MGHKKVTISEWDPAKVRIGDDRTRKDMGDLDALARSIDAVGLLHPIIITAGGKLVAGERRLRAVRDILKWEKVSCSVVNLDALQAEHDENQVRKDFTASERVAIAKAIREAFGERRGRPAVSPVIPEKIPELQPPKGEETRRTAARAAGFGNEKTLEQAKKVVEHGTITLVEAMDTKTVSVGAAAKIADLPPEKQEEVVKKVRAGKKPRKAIAEAVGRQEKEPQAKSTGPVDALDVPVGDHGPVFADTAKFDELKSLLRKASKLIHELAESPGGAYYRTQLSHKGSTEGKMRHYCPHLVNVVNRLEWARPHTRCPYCHHEGKTDRNCRGCHGLGWVTKQTFDTAPEDYRKAVETMAAKGAAS